MTLPGGPADKLGNRYEKWWTLTQRSLAASRTVCGPTTRSLLWRPSFAVSDPDAPPLDSESLVTSSTGTELPMCWLAGSRRSRTVRHAPRSTSISCRAGRRTISMHWQVLYAPRMPVSEYQARKVRWRCRLTAALSVITRYRLGGRITATSMLWSEPRKGLAFRAARILR